MANNPYGNFVEDDESKPIENQAPAEIPGDRGEPSTKVPKKRKPGVIIAIVAVLVFAIAAIAFMMMFFLRAIDRKDDQANAQVQEDPALQSSPSTGPSMEDFQRKVAAQLELNQRRQREQEEAARKAAEEAAKAKTPPLPAPSLGQLQGQSAQAAAIPPRNSDAKEQPLTPAEQAAQRRWDDDVMWDSRSGSAGSGIGQPGPADAGGLDSIEQGGSGKNSIGNMLKTETYANGRASIRQDLKFLLMHGTSIPCTLLPRIVTNYPGQTTCLINRDVYSADGSVVLISRGSRVNGERKVSMKQGIAKVFVAWGSIETPDGVQVRIDSMAADQLGAAGLDAWIDNHWAERFGGAILLSFLEDVFRAIGDSASNDDGMTFDNSTGNGEDMASTALENSINIEPTGYVKHATETTIIVARDVDFRSVYGIE